MARFMIETAHTPDAKVDEAMALVAKQFPEVVVDHRYIPHGATGSELWFCRAPGAAHVHRWVEAADLDAPRITQVDLDR